MNKKDKETVPALPLPPPRLPPRNSQSSHKTSIPRPRESRPKKDDFINLLDQVPPPPSASMITDNSTISLPSPPQPQPQAQPQSQMQSLFRTQSLAQEHTQHFSAVDTNQTSLRSVSSNLYTIQNGKSLMTTAFTQRASIVNNQVYFAAQFSQPPLGPSTSTNGSTNGNGNVYSNGNATAASGISHSFSAPSFLDVINEQTFASSFSGISGIPGIPGISGMCKNSLGSHSSLVTLTQHKQLNHLKSSTSTHSFSASNNFQNNSAYSRNLIDLGFGEESMVRKKSNGDRIDDVLLLFDPLLEAMQNEAREKDHHQDIEESHEIGDPRSRSSPQTEPQHERNDDLVDNSNRISRTENKQADQLEGASKRKSEDLSLRSSFRVVRRALTANEAILGFVNKLRNLRAEFSADDGNTNIGLVISSTHETQRDNSLSVKLVIETKLSESPVCFTCNVNTSIEHIISHVVCTLMEDVSQLNFDDYVLKVMGLNEYLAVDSALADYVYVHQCHKFDRDVRLTLVSVKELDRLFARTAADDEKCLNITCDDILPKTVIDHFRDVNHKSVNIFLETLDNEICKLWETSRHESGQFYTQGVRQAMKAVCSLFGRLETVKVTEALEDFFQQFVVLREYQQQASGSFKADIKIGFAEVLEHAVSKLHQALAEMITLYCAAFPVGFDVPKEAVKQKGTFNEAKTVLITNSMDSLLVYIGSVGQLCPEWKSNYSEFFISCQLYHGERKLASAKSRSVSVSQNLFHRLSFEEWLDFESMPLNKLPREACLRIRVIGVEHFNPDSGSGSSSPGVEGPRDVHTVLGLSVLRLYDFEETLVQGPLLLGMWTNEVLKSDALSVTSNCFERNAPNILLSLPEFASKVRFPSIVWDQQPTATSRGRRDIRTLDSATQTDIHQVLNKDPIEPMNEEDKRMLWDRRHYLYDVPDALSKVLKSAQSWDWSSLSDIYWMIDKWNPLSPIDAMQLLLPTFPDIHVRMMAVKWTRRLGCDELCDFLPQLVQALRYEAHIDSPLVWFFIEKSLTSVRVAHRLYWLFKENVNDPLLGYRSRIMLNALLAVGGKAMREVFEKQGIFLDKLTLINEDVKTSKESLRLANLQQSLWLTDEFLQDLRTGVPLPLSPSMMVYGVDVASCSYFTSNTLPLKLVFKSLENKPESHIEALYKIGDDLRQDMLTIQMIQIMDKLWLKEGLDLKIVTFSCVATDDRKGMVEMVKSAETLRKIQTEQGVAGSFKERSIAEWLQRHNTIEYLQATDNFTHSCAGYAIATYVLGIKDRHNDNIMITTSGHLFHIDFGKFLGDAQMMGNIKRDRVPFVLTSDMAYVINGGTNSSKQFQYFVELCCQAFNIIRRHTNLFLSLFSLMISSGIPGVSPESVKYVHKALLPSLSEAEATSQFTRMIEESLSSRSTQINFLIHSLAQLRFTGDHNDQRLLSFATKTYTRETDGKIHGLEVVDCFKKKEPEKQYFFVVKIERAFQPDPSHVRRTYREFCEFHQKLSSEYRLANFHPLARVSTIIGRSNTREVANRRKAEINTFLHQLLKMAEEVSHSNLVYTFFHPIFRDQEVLSGDQPPLGAEGQLVSRRERIPRKDSLPNGQVKVSVVYKNGSLIIMIMHAKNLLSTRSSAPDCYVKSYLVPDANKLTKRKTKIVWKSSHPTFMEMIIYQMPLETVKKRILHVSVWDYDRVQENLFLGAALIRLQEMDLLHETVSWYPFTG